MKVGDIVELRIESIGMDGGGVARMDGIVVFVPYTLIGELVRCKISFVKKSFAHAKVIKVLEESAKRITPICKQFFKCGGCTMMHLADEEYGTVKVENLINCMRKIAKVECDIKLLIKVGSQHGYRNKIQLPIGTYNGKIVVGYYEEKTHNIVPFDKCYLHGEWADKIIRIFLKFANDYDLSAYNEVSGKGLLRHLALRTIDNKVSVVVVINGKALPHYKELIERLSGIDCNLHININIKNTNVITSDEYVCLSGAEYLSGEINGVKVSLSPTSFMQINTDVAVEIYNNINQRLKEIGDAVVLESYSGIGILSNMIAKNCKGIISIEIIESAVRDAEKMIIENNNQNKILPICGDAALIMPKIAKAFKVKNTSELEQDDAFNKTKLNKLQPLINGDNTLVAIIDPPRKGCEEIVMDALLDAEPQFVYYISCNPATLARDIALLSPKYEVINLTPYDMFPLTSSIEVFAELKRRNHEEN